MLHLVFSDYVSLNKQVDVTYADLNLTLKAVLSNQEVLLQVTTWWGHIQEWREVDNLMGTNEVKIPLFVAIDLVELDRVGTVGLDLWLKHGVDLVDLVVAGDTFLTIVVEEDVFAATSLRLS